MEVKVEAWKNGDSGMAHLRKCIQRKRRDDCGSISNSCASGKLL